MAEAGQVILHATVNPAHTAMHRPGGVGDTGDLRTRADASISMRKGSVIDVSGSTDNRVAMERNQPEVPLTGIFLNDAPLQREGVLRNERILVDTRLGTPLGDISALVDTEVRRDVSERLSNGGNIQLISQGSVVLNQGLQINIKAGAVTFNAGYVTTSQLVDINARVVDVTDADPANIYQGVYGVSTQRSTRWGQTQSWRVAGGGNTQFYDSYTQGQNAGLVNAIAHAAELNNDLIAGTTVGPFQRLASNRPAGGEFRLTLGGGVNLASLAPTQSINFVGATGQPSDSCRRWRVAACFQCRAG